MPQGNGVSYGLDRGRSSDGVGAGKLETPGDANRRAVR